MTIRNGSFVFARTYEHADDAVRPAGLVIDCWDGDDDHLVAGYRVVNVWRGQIVYNTIDAQDATTGTLDGEIDRKAIRVTIKALAAEIARTGNTAEHLGALTVLSAALNRPAPAGSAR